jgi:signal transduction histidine kinase
MPILNKTLWPISDELVNQVRQFRRLPEKYRFEICCDHSDFEVLADRKKIGQVLENLISNALKYSPQGGLIMLKTVIDQGYLRVSVCDEGIGMTDEQRTRAFEKFYRADTRETAIGGFGLGLAIAQNIIEAHGGRIWLESEIDKGTCSYFTLPAGHKQNLNKPLENR